MYVYNTVARDIVGFSDDGWIREESEIKKKKEFQGLVVVKVRIELSGIH